MADEREPEAGPSTRAATLLPPSNIAQYDPTSTSEDEADDSDRNPPTTYSPKKRKSSGNLRSQTINYDTGYTPPPLPGHDLPDFSILSASNHPAQYAPNSLPYPSTSSVTSHGAAPLVMVDEEDKEKGRRKIQIEYIEEKSKRHITFSKRKAGIMKKAYELSTLTGTQVLLLVVSESGWVYTFTTDQFKPLVKEDEFGNLSQGQKLIAACLENKPPIDPNRPNSAGHYPSPHQPMQPLPPHLAHQQMQQQQQHIPQMHCPQPMHQQQQQQMQQPPHQGSPSTPRPTLSNRRVSTTGKGRPAPIRIDMAQGNPSQPSPMSGGPHSGSLSGNLMQQQQYTLPDSSQLSPGGPMPGGGPMAGGGSRRGSLHPSSPHRANQISYLQQQQMQGARDGSEQGSAAANQEYAEMMQRVNGNPFASPMHQQAQYQPTAYGSPAANDLLHHQSLQNLQLSPSRGQSRPLLARGHSDTHLGADLRQQQYPTHSLHYPPPPSFDPSRQPPPPSQFGDSRSQQPMYSAQVSPQELDEASQQPRTIEGNALNGEGAKPDDISVNPAHLSGDAEEYTAFY